MLDVEEVTCDGRKNRKGKQEQYPSGNEVDDTDLTTEILI
eukprot:CAMPEP_0169111262 /NCGR_PEP_ID=MMETSP1015-20121227/26967_1 /TAXON_ID=342587 /ORGANISM="Karlodinium micrum, Strain CCMP2283" /LENGTH=39 /DNA_ID= /DNA_START= /DNA_END= /DNA_ORIENTATION=